MALSEAQKRNAEKNRQYWAKREAEQLKHNITDEREYDKELQRIYKSMLDSVQSQIDGFYGRYASKEGITLAEAKKRVAKLDIEAYERKAEQYVKTKDFSPKANEQMRIYNLTMKVNRLEMLKANIGLEMIAGHDELEKFMSEILQGRTMDELERQAGILGKTVRNNAQKANAIVNASFHNATFSDRIWQYQDLMRIELDRLLQTGLIQGKNPRAIAKDLQKYWYGNDPATGGGALYCMERLMRTELARVQTEAQKQSFQRNGFEEYMFIVNGGCCEICADLNGKHFKVSKMQPGENAPPMHPHCRCSVAAWEDSAEYNAWLDYLASGGTTEEWNAKKNGKASTAEKSAAYFRDLSANTTKLKAEMGEADYQEFMKMVQRNPVVSPLYALADKFEFVLLKTGGGAGGRKCMFSWQDERFVENGASRYGILAHEYGHMMDDKDLYSGAGLTFAEMDALRKALRNGGTFYDRVTVSDQFLKAVRKDTAVVEAKLEDVKKYCMRKSDTTIGVQDAIAGMGVRKLRWGHSGQYYNQIYNDTFSRVSSEELSAAYAEVGLKVKSESALKKISRDYTIALELWANIASAITVNDAELESLKLYFPESVEAFLQIVKTVKQG